MEDMSTKEGRNAKNAEPIKVLFKGKPIGYVTSIVKWVPASHVVTTYIREENPSSRNYGKSTKQEWVISK